ncbi:ATP-binding protein [Dokdonella soli]|uniref:ATPase n=1 Tax=Dokdonella soli TaxID=529810 RepID=A0ABN1IEW6_9GAMM
MNTPLLLAWSGGKDSALALQRLLDDPRWRVEGLLTTVTMEYDRISIHGVRRSILQAQAERLRLPLIEARIPPQASNAIYETAFANALDEARARTPGIDTIAFGDLFLADIRAYREQQLARHGWRGHFPLWGEDTTRLARRFIADGHRAILCCVDTQQLDAAFCGREFDAELLVDLPPSCDPCGENGEFHTCVYTSPLWREPLVLARGERVLRDGRFQYVDLLGI